MNYLVIKEYTLFLIDISKKLLRENRAHLCLCSVVSLKAQRNAFGSGVFQMKNSFVKLDYWNFTIHNTFSETKD